MDSNCGEIKDKVADLITGILAEAEIETVQEHLGRCSSCAEYARALQEEDELLAGLFAGFDANMRGWQDDVISALSQTGTSRQREIVSVGKAVMRNLVARHAAAAAVMIVVTLYFIITITWIWQINECIRHCL